MTRTPIPNCPQPETPLRDRAWTDEQRLARLRELANECRKPYPEGAHGTRYADGYNDACNDIADQILAILDAEDDGEAVGDAVSRDSLEQPE